MEDVCQAALLRAKEVPVDHARMDELIDIALDDGTEESIVVGKVKEDSAAVSR